MGGTEDKTGCDQGCSVRIRLRHSAVLQAAPIYFPEFRGQYTGNSQ